jgi:Fe-S-cluster containining protein
MNAVESGFGLGARMDYDRGMIHPNPSDCITEYLRLRDEVDARVQELLACHGDHITCGPGCCECCVNFTVFALEFEAILQGLTRRGATLAFDESGSCGFLAGRRCRIYDHRPIICRTHGLPIAFFDEQSAGHSVSFCPKNFTHADLDDYAFGPSNTLDLDDLNERLSRLNARFLGELGPAGIDRTGRIDLRRLADALGNPPRQ